MNTILALIEKLLVGIFVLGFLSLIAVGVLRYQYGPAEDGDPWKQVQAQNTVEAYLDYLRGCQTCPNETIAERALDEAQRPLGLIARLDRRDLPERASINLPVLAPDGRTVLAAGGAGPAFWNADTGQRLAQDEAAFATPGGRTIRTLAYAPDGLTVAAGLSGAEAGNLRVWDRKRGELLGDYLVEGYDVEVVAFAPQGGQVGWLAHGPAGVWDPATGQFLRVTHEGATSLAFTRNGQGRVLLLTASGRELWFWDPASLERVGQLETRSERTLLGLSQDGKLAAYFEGPVLELWDTATGQLAYTLKDHDNDVVSFCREPRKGWIVVGTKAGTLYLWAPAEPKRLGWVAAHEGPIEQMSCSANARVVTSAWDSAKVWDLEKLRGWYARRQN
jgi:WD40 repeat protein